MSMNKRQVGILSAGFIAVFAAGLMVWAASMPPESNWSKPCNGIEVRLSSGRAYYRAGDGIRIYVKFRNVGDGERTIKLGSLYGCVDMSHNGKGFAEAIGCYPRGIDELRLLPGETSRKLYLCGCVTAFKGAGIYEFRGDMSDEHGWNWGSEKLVVHVW